MPLTPAQIIQTLDLAPHPQEEQEEANAPEARSGGRLAQMIRQRFLTAHPTRSTR